MTSIKHNFCRIKHIFKNIACKFLRLYAVALLQKRHKNSSWMSTLVEMKPRSVNLNASDVSKNINDLKSDGILQTLTDYVKEREIIYHVISYASLYVRYMQSIAFMPERDLVSSRKFFNALCLFALAKKVFSLEWYLFCILAYYSLGSFAFQTCLIQRL